MHKNRARALQIIVIFAFLHAILSLVARFTGFNDELTLTLLTMMMSILLSLETRMNLAFMLIWLILVNFGGLFLGKWIGWTMRHVLYQGCKYRFYLIGPSSTFVTTAVLGFAQLACALLVSKKKKNVKTDLGNDIVWLLFAFLTVITIRMSLILKSADDLFRENISLNITIDYAFTLLAVFYMARYSLKAKKAMDREAEMRHQAQYSYKNLKQQIEPHFLFNSLNSLDGLIKTKDTATASSFVKKLSRLYRYMIDNENEPLVYLKDEIKFVKLYVDLMKVRFPKGFDVVMDLSDKGYKHFVVPCAIQLLVENATKHNAITTKNPLTINLFIDGDYIVVSNNIIPKETSQPSTGRGLTYISQQYLDKAGKDIIIVQDKESYTVKLPLI